LAALAVGGLSPHTVLAAPLIQATKTHALLVDLNHDGHAGAGDTLRYTVTITNTGDMDACGVEFSDALDDNTSLVPGSVRTTPLARNDGYSIASDARLEVDAATGLLSNDNDPDGSPIIVVAFDSQSAEGGFVTVNAVGAFTYTPPSGFSGEDTLFYRIGDNDANLDIGLVRINVGVGGPPVDSCSGPDLPGPFHVGTLNGAVTLSGGTFPGQHVVITFDVIVNESTPPTVSEVCNQGTVSGDNLAESATDDPDTGAHADPTCTSLVPTAPQMIQDAIETVEDLPPTAFFNRNSRTALLNKLREVQANIASGTLCALCQALSKVVHDVLPKIDGVSPPPDWVTDQLGRERLAEEVHGLIDQLQAEVSAQGGCGGC
jgi:uncharacterized repeat protein (TIGR01451 family)